MWKISKQFDFCYGHRVWSQQLNSEFSVDSCLACRHLHGHQGTILIHLEGESLKDGMVTDFKHLNWFKKWLDDTLDHKFIMDINDPLRDVLFPLSFSSVLKDNNRYRVVNEDVYKNSKTYEKELYEGLILVDFVPTSENLSKWIYDIVSAKMRKLDVTVSAVEFFETPKSCSIYLK